MSKVSRILIICLYLTFTLWSFPQTSRVSAAAANCPIEPIIEFDKDNLSYQLKKGTPLPEGVRKVYFTFQNANNFLKEGITYRLYIQWDQALSAGVPGGPSSEAQLIQGKLTLDTSDSQFFRATPKNAIYKVTLQQKDANGQYPSDSDEGVCGGMGYTVGSANTFNTCEIGLSNESPGLGETVIAIVRNSPDGYYIVSTNFKDLDHPQGQSIQVKNGSSSFVFKTPDTTSMAKAEVALMGQANPAAGLPLFFCVNQFTVRPEPAANKVSCSPDPAEPSIFEEATVKAANLQAGEAYWARRINKNTGEKVDLAETIAQPDRTASLPLSVSPNKVPEGAYDVQVYKKNGDRPVCETDLQVKAAVAAALIKKRCVVKAENDNTPLKPDEMICASGGGLQIPGCGIPDKNRVPDPRGPGIPTAIGCIHTSPVEFTKDLMTFIIGISGGLAFLMMLLGAFQMLTSAGNPETLQAGRERLTSAVIGLLIVIFATLLLQIIGLDILKIPGFER